MRALPQRLKAPGFRRLLGAAVLGAMVLGAAGCLLGLRAAARALPTLRAAADFRGESGERFAQIACFLPEGEGRSEEDIYAFRQTLDAKLLEQSLEAPEGGSLTVDAYCALTEVKAGTDGGGTFTVDAVAVGGDFFAFHPLTLLSGNYIREDDLMDDLVVLDRETAWKLFGGTDLAGMTVTVEGRPFVVAGVVERETDAYSRRAYDGDGMLFLSFSALSRMQEDAEIVCYECVCPDPISGFALGLVTENFDTGGGDIVENSARYSLSRLLSVIGSFGERSMRTNGVIYPYWENAARLTEDYAALLLLLAALLLALPALTALVLAVRSAVRLYRLAKRKLPEKAAAAVERRREERYRERTEQNGEGEDHGGGAL